MIGKIQPQAIELEKVVLGAMMLEREKVDLAMNILTQDHFYDDKLRMVFKAIEILYKENSPIDLITVSNQLREMNNLESVGGPFFIAELTSRIASAANIEFHCRILTEKFISRQIIKISSEFTEKAFDDTLDCFVTLDALETKLGALRMKSLSNKEALSIGQVNYKNLKRLESLKNSSVIGIPTGLTSLDNILGGWQSKKLYIIAARPGRGKTALALLACKSSAIDLNVPTAIFSLEMPDEEFSSRLFSMTTSIYNSSISKNRLKEHDWDELRSAHEMMLKKPLYIDDGSPLTISELKVKARMLVKKHKVKLIIIDYLQLMTSNEKGQNRESIISEISRGLKSLAKELDLPIIALAQLSREIEKRGANAHPMLSDLRESGSIEQDADCVIFIHSPDFDYNESIIDIDLIVAKNRGGLAGTTANEHGSTIRFNKNFVRFENIIII